MTGVQTCALPIYYGCAVYGSARYSILRPLDPVHHQALRLCTGAFRTSPVHSLYVESHEPPLRVRRLQLSLQLYVKLRSLPDHPLYESVFSPLLVRLFDHRPTCVSTFGIRMSPIARDAGVDLSLVGPTILYSEPPWEPLCVSIDLSFTRFPKATTPESVYQWLFAEHRHLHPGFVPIYTDGSKSGDVVGSAYICNDYFSSVRLPQIGRAHV